MSGGCRSMRRCRCLADVVERVHERPALLRAAARPCPAFAAKTWRCCGRCVRPVTGFGGRCFGRCLGLTLRANPIGQPQTTDVLSW